MYYGGTGYKNDQGLGVQLTPSGGKLPDAPANRSAFPKVEIDSLLAVPVNTLYNRSTQLMKSEILHQRIPEPFGRFNPVDAKEIGVLGGETVQFELDDRPYSIQVRVDESVPQGYVLVPRKMGIPLYKPTPVSIHVLEMVAGS
jgi:anaerobic selenocysteine-containing dehydrogenase